MYEAKKKNKTNKTITYLYNHTKIFLCKVWNEKTQKKVKVKLNNYIFFLLLNKSIQRFLFLLLYVNNKKNNSRRNQKRN